MTMIIILFIVWTCLWITIFVTNAIVFCKWEKKKQENCEYKRLKLFSFKISKFRLNACILQYNPNTDSQFYIENKIPNAKYWKKYITLKGNSVFGLKTNYGYRFYYKDTTPIFRPDITMHSIRTYEEQCTKLSLEFIKFII